MASSSNVPYILEIPWILKLNNTRHNGGFGRGFGDIAGNRLRKLLGSDAV